MDSFLAKSLGVIGPKLLDFIHERSSQNGSARSHHESSAVSSSHYMSHAEGSKHGGVSKRREVQKMTLPES